MGERGVSSDRPRRGCQEEATRVATRANLQDWVSRLAVHLHQETSSMGFWRTMLVGVLVREVGGDKMCGVEVEWGDLG